MTCCSDRLNPQRLVTRKGARGTRTRPCQIQHSQARFSPRRSRRYLSRPYTVRLLAWGIGDSVRCTASTFQTSRASF